MTCEIRPRYHSSHAGHQSHQIQELQRTQTQGKYHTRTHIGRLPRAHSHPIIIHPAHHSQEEHHRPRQKWNRQDRRLPHPAAERNRRDFQVHPGYVLSHHRRYLGAHEITGTADTGSSSENIEVHQDQYRVFHWRHHGQGGLYQD